MANKPPVKVIVVGGNERPRVVLGTTRDGSDTEGTRTAGAEAIRPRDAESIRLALPTREQTALFFEVSPAVRAMLLGMGDTGVNGRRAAPAEPMKRQTPPGTRIAAEAESKRQRVSGGPAVGGQGTSHARRLRARHGKRDG